MRHGALTHPGDAEVRSRDDQFMVGRDLLAAPVLRPGQTRRSLRLPAGTWVDGLAYREADGAFAARPAAPVLAGGREAELDAPVDELPLLVRAGAVLPLLPADVDTLADAYRAPGVVSLADRRSRLRLIAFPRGRSRSAFGVGGALVSRESRRAWTLVVRGARGRRVALQASLVALRRPGFGPCRVTVDGRRTRFTHDAGARVLRVAFTARRATARVRVARCGR
jgi:hypothetical protein